MNRILVFAIIILFLSNCEDKKNSNSIPIKKTDSSLNKEEIWCKKNYTSPTQKELDLIFQCANYGYSVYMAKLSDYYFCEKKDMNHSNHWSDIEKITSGMISTRNYESMTGKIVEVLGSYTMMARTQLTPKELEQTIKFATDGNLTAMEILAEYYLWRDGEDAKGEIWAKKSRYGFEKKFGHINTNHNLTQNEISVLEKKANTGDIESMYILRWYFEDIDENKKMIWLKKLSTSNEELFFKIDYLRLLFQSQNGCSNEVKKLARKWDLEFFFQDCFKKKYPQCEQK